MVDFNTDKHIVVCYPRQAGGKFLINSLGLSDSAVFQHAGIAEMQLSGKLSTVEKLTYLLRKINETSTKWLDLGLGDAMLFGILEEDYMQLVPELNFFPVVDELSNSGKYFFSLVHYPIHLPYVLAQWPNSKVIKFENYDNFIHSRKNKDENLIEALERLWASISDPMWGDVPTSVSEYNNLPARIIEELELDFNNDVYKLIAGIDSNEFTRVSNIITKSIGWDVTWYDSMQYTVQHIQELYRLFDLNPVNQSYLEEYYTAWINKIT